jgi:hypothetical protein
MDEPVFEPGPTWRDEVGLTVHTTFNVQEGGMYWTLKRIVCTRFCECMKTMID